MAPHAALNTQDIAEKARRDLLQLLEGVRGKKNLVLEKSLADTLSLIVKTSTLREYGVDKFYFLENDNVDSSQRNVVFLARGEKAKTVIAIAEQINHLRRNGQVDHEFSIFWIPRRTLVSNQILEEAGVLGEVNIAEYPLYFIPLADDLLSMELDDAFSDLYLRRDPTATFLAAKALMLMQQRHGLFPRIIGKGDNAKRLADLLLRMRSEVTAGDDSYSNGASSLGLTPSSSIESLIIIDREVDLPTVLLTQLTYEGLIDEIFGIKANQTEVDSSIVGATPAQAPQVSSASSSTPALKRKIQLDSSDALYSTLQDSNFAIVGSLLNKVARRLQSSYESRHVASKSTAELREFVAKLPGYQAEQASLKIHTALAEEIIKHTRSDIFSRILEVQQNLAAGADPTSQHDSIDELISRALPLPTVLRLLCLESCVSGGLKRSDLETFKRAILHGYGHQHLLTLSALEKLGLLTMQAVNESEPDDIAYVFSGYAPLSVRLVQCILQKQYLASLGTSRAAAAATPQPQSAAQGWRPFEDVVKQVKGATFDEAQTGEEKAVRARQTLNGSGGGESGKTVVVFFLGGVCRAEVAALRFVAKRLKEEGVGRRVVIATTGMVSGDGVVGAAIEKKTFGGA
ncbi:Vacuolar protein-sorting-associated protein 33 [Coniosporium tulheliwenetii]|uniref:Vacuolar protein-sorting-associated protein 33 n=1 Tax=Coniosporium tulheliwenetii TaxID=3383036 RepID=A0ACC2ZLV5_9PEZI|nr:Vacuolar protein-sorting-associated protein 33 [Cladosporium sp. JES 115]